MSTKTKRPNIASRRWRKNPSREREYFPAAQWEAEVKTKKRGKNRADTQRKVETTGIVKIDVADLFDEVKLLLRQGKEVRLTSEVDGEAIRLYPCLDANYKEMFVAAMSMGSFRKAISDIPFQILHRGEVKDVMTAKAEKVTRMREIAAARREHVTPDTMATCPRCRYEFRIGKKLN